MRIRADASPKALLAAYVHSRRSSHERWIAGRVLPEFSAALRAQRVPDLRQGTEAHVVSFLASLQRQRNRRGQPVSDDQRRKWLGVLRGFYRFLQERRLVLVNPAAGVRLQAPRRLPPASLSEAQMRRLVAAPFRGSPIGQRDHAILELLYGVGLRLGECVRLDLHDVSLAQGQLLVRNGKGRKDRLLPLVGRAQHALDIYLRDVRPQLARSSREDALFLSRDGQRLAWRSLQTRLQVHGRKIGLRFRLRPHLLRHACATHLLRGGADIRHVQRLLGHKDLRTTAIYTHVDTSDLRAMLERAHPREHRVK